MVILGLQLILPGGAPPADAPGLAARRQRPVAIPPLPEYAAILASPIFAPDRRPGAPGGGSSDSGGGSLGGYAALGAASGRTVATVVLSAPGGGLKTLRRGDEIEGWRLVGVDSTRVTFERNGVRHALVIGAPPEGGITAPPEGGITAPPEGGITPPPDAVTPGMNQ